jgi:hypothetical protein
MKLTQAQLAHIKSLEDHKGNLSARRVLEDARKPKSPLHNLSVFGGWDRNKASEKHWLHCCQLVIGAVTYQFTHNHKVVKAVAYVVDPAMKSAGGGYRSVQALKHDPPSARESLVYTLETAAGHLRRGYELAVPLGLQREIDSLLVQIAGVQRIVKGVKKAA